MSRLTDHYETVRNRHGSDRVDFDLGPLTASALRRRFVAVDGREAVARALERPTMVSTGVGMTGPPHLGTVGQILTAIDLQEAGLPVQFVIADLEPYHGGADGAYVFELAERYRSFILDLGFDPDNGVLRTQDEDHDVMHTGHRLARYYAPDEWEGPDSEKTEWERAVRDAYKRDGVDRGESGPTSDAAGAHSGVLHGADFLHPLSEWEYEQVIIVLGIDEHGLTPWTRRFLDATSVEGTVAGLHTRMLPGFDGMPKMSKSIPGSGVALDTSSETIRERIRESDDGGGDPSASPVFQSMCLTSRYGPDRLDSLERACEAGGEEWETAKADYAEYVVELAERWQAAGE